MKKIIKKTGRAVRSTAAVAAKLLAAAVKMIIKTVVLLAEDVLIISGLGMIVYATFCWSRVAGLYAAGVCLFGLGVWAALHPPHRKWKG